MARGKPLTGFLLALSHSPELARRFSDPDRRGEVLQEWNLGEHELFATGELTLERVQRAVAAEHEGEGEAEASGPSVGVAWWIWFFGGPK